MSVGVVTHDSLAKPDDIFNTVIISKISFYLVLIQVGVSVGIEQAGGGGEEVATAVDIDAAAFHHDTGREEREVGHKVMDVHGHLSIKLIGIFTAPCVVVPVDDGTRLRVVVIEKESRTVIAAPSIVAWNDMQTDILHIAIYFFKFYFNMLEHSLIIDIDVHPLALGKGFDEEMIRGVDGLNLARPGVGILGIGEPSCLVACPFGGHEKTLFFGGHFQLKVKS